MKQRDIRSRRNFNVLIDEYYNLWVRLTRERITMPLVKIRFLQTWGLVFRSAWTSRKLDNTVIIIAFLSEERIGNHVFLAMMSLRNEVSSSINRVFRQWREENRPGSSKPYNYWIEGEIANRIFVSSGKLLRISFDSLIILMEFSIKIYNL